MAEYNPPSFGEADWKNIMSPHLSQNLFKDHNPEHIKRILNAPFEFGGGLPKLPALKFANSVDCPPSRRSPSYSSFQACSPYPAVSHADLTTLGSSGITQIPRQPRDTPAPRLRPKRIANK